MALTFQRKTLVLFPLSARSKSICLRDLLPRFLLQFLLVPVQDAVRVTVGGHKAHIVHAGPTSLAADVRGR